MSTLSEEAKIFCIGLSKTGTTSLAAALDVLGYNVRDNIGVTRFAPGDLGCIDAHELESHDAFTDTPIPSYYRELDAKYPNAKFILTVRDQEGWLKSCKKQFNQKHAEMRHDAINDLFIDMYGSAWFDEEKFTSGYNRFVNGVKEHFKDRPDNLLILDLCSGDGWDKLCAFLDKPVPDSPFPITNVTKIQWLRVEDVVALAREAGKKIPAPDKLVFPDSAPDQSIIGTLSRPLRGSIVKHRRKALSKKLDSAYNTIVDGLKALNASIPVLSKKTQHIPYSERKNWSHVWLVDTFEGEHSLLNGDETYSINIALVENGVVRMGVVYFPSRDMMYYTKNGTVSYKQVGDENAIKLETIADIHCDALPVLAAHENISTQLQGRHSTPSNISVEVQESAPLALCTIAEGSAKAFQSAQPFMEWEIAAGHAVANSIKISAKEINHDGPVRYNTESLIINAVFTRVAQTNA